MAEYLHMKMVPIPEAPSPYGDGRQERKRKARPRRLNSILNNQREDINLCYHLASLVEDFLRGEQEIGHSVPMQTGIAYQCEE